MTKDWKRAQPRRRRPTVIRLQSGCAICGERPDGRGLAQDHCHATERERDLLCQRCNVGLGQFRDRPDLLRRAADYLQCHAEGRAWLPPTAEPSVVPGDRAGEALHALWMMGKLAAQTTEAPDGERYHPEPKVRPGDRASEALHDLWALSRAMQLARLAAKAGR